jgi:hypothetical protein
LEEKNEIVTGIAVASIVNHSDSVTLKKPNTQFSREYGRELLDIDSDQDVYQRIRTGKKNGILSFQFKYIF